MKRGKVKMPAWVPNGAKLFIDLAGQKAWTRDDGVVTLDALLGQDPETEGYWGPTSALVAADFHPTGYCPRNLPPALIGRARSMFLDPAGVTAVFSVYWNVAQSVHQPQICGMQGADVAAFAFYCTLLSTRCHFMDSLGCAIFVNENTNRGQFQTTKVAFTYINDLAVGRGSVSCNGGAVATAPVVGDPENQGESSGPFVAAVASIAGEAHWVDFALYDPVADADLPALSDI